MQNNAWVPPQYLYVYIRLTDAHLAKKIMIVSGILRPGILIEKLSF